MSNVLRSIPGGESLLQARMEQWFKGLDMPFTAQWKTSSGKADLVLFYQKGLAPWCIIEIKPGICPHTTKVAALAGYFEQCVKYHFNTGLPVFLGPIFIPTMGIDWCVEGGAEPKTATAAFSAYAGRVNVGLFFIQASPGAEHDPSAWGGFRMTMRQQTVARYSKAERNTIWPARPIDMVSFDKAPSASIRVAS